MQFFKGLEYLKIDIASNFGLEKELWNTRLEWFEANKHQLRRLHNQAEEPALYYAGILAYEASQRGEPSGYPISLDATASGMQILAILAGDRSAAELCNVVPTGKREDAYTTIYDRIVTAVGGASNIDRKDTKQAVMTSLFGSTAVPKEVFGNGDQYKAFVNTMSEGAPGVWELNKAFVKIWDDTVMCHTWVLPDNFHVKIKVMDVVKESVQFLDAPYTISREINAPTKGGKSLGANVTHSLDGMVVREMNRRCNYDPHWIGLVRDMLASESDHYLDASVKAEASEMVKTLWANYQRSGYLSARILNYIDSDTIKLVDVLAIEELVLSLPSKPFEILCVHDCFRVLPSYGNDLRSQYNRQLYELAKSNILSDLVSQILNRPIKLGKLDSTMYLDILQADYTLS